MRQFRILEGDALAVLGTLASESVHCCITSPPYWGLRDYGTARWAGGDAECDHLGKPFRTKSSINANWGAGYSDQKNRDDREPMGQTCSKCGAERIDAQIGLERTPGEYVAQLVAVFREVRRVLRPDATCWINLGDSYANNGESRNGVGKTGLKRNVTDEARRLQCCAENKVYRGVKQEVDSGLKPKDLVGIPWRVAFALQADGWYLRSDIIWAKPNPMPESVTDRPTKAHEYIFLLAKNERYFYDADAILEPVKQESLDRARYAPSSYALTIHNANGRRAADGTQTNPEGRNKRTVWTQSTQPYAEAHFATFPEELIRPCVLAGCPLGGVVLDCFAGSGTTGVVALGLDRGFVGIELNATYAAMARNRIAGDQPLFNAEAEQELAWTT